MDSRAAANCLALLAVVTWAGACDDDPATINGVPPNAVPVASGVPFPGEYYLYSLTIEATSPGVAELMLVATRVGGRRRPRGLSATRFVRLTVMEPSQVSAPMRPPASGNKGATPAAP